MRVAIAGAGNVGRSIARELISNGHQVFLMEKDPMAINPDSVPGAEWFQADACELQTLEEAELKNCDVAIAANYEIGRASCRKECRSRWSPYH